MLLRFLGLPYDWEGSSLRSQLPEFLIFSLIIILFFLLNSNIFWNKTWRYSNRIWCDLFNTNIRNYKITKLKWKLLIWKKVQKNKIHFFLFHDKSSRKSFYLSALGCECKICSHRWIHRIYMYICICIYICIKKYIYICMYVYIPMHI